MSLKFTPAQTWTIATGAAVAVLALVTAFDFLMPKPKVNMTAAKVVVEENKLRADTKRFIADLDELETQVARLTWTANAEQIGSSSLSKVTNLANSNGLKLLAFRPQRSVQDKNLLRLPYTISLEGPYVGVVRFLGGLEATDNKLAVNLVQVASADPNSDRVSGTVGVLAFQRLEDKTKPSPKTASTAKEAMKK